MSHLTVWGKILLFYAMIFAGVVPLFAALFAIFQFGALEAIGAIPINLAVSIFSMLVILKGRAFFIPFGFSVMLHYYGITSTNIFYFNDLMVAGVDETRAIGRILRGILFGSVYLWYFVFRTKTKIEA